MNVTEAARQWVEYQRAKAAWLAKHGPEPKAAADVLKRWFRDHPDKRVYRGIAYSSAPTSRLDPELVRAELDPKALQRCTVPGTRETLSLVEKEAPKPAGRKAPRS